MSVNYHEWLNVRLVTGQVDPRTGVAVPVTGCIPAQQAKSGQFTSEGVNVLGDGSSNFLDEFKIDDFIYSASLNEIRRVKAVSSKFMELDYAFSVDRTVAEDVFKAPTQIYKRVHTINTGGADAVVQEVPLPSTYSDIRGFDLGCAPFTYNSTGTVLMFHLSQ